MSYQALNRHKLYRFTSLVISQTVYSMLALYRGLGWGMLPRKFRPVSDFWRPKANYRSKLLTVLGKQKNTSRLPPLDTAPPLSAAYVSLHGSSKKMQTISI